MSYNPFPPVNAAAGAAVPAEALWVAGTDGTDLRGILVDTSGREIVVGAAAAGAAVAGNPVLVGGSDGTDARSLTTDSSGRLITVQYRSDGRAYPLGSNLVQQNVATTTTTIVPSPGSGKHVLLKTLSVAVNTVTGGQYILVTGTINGTAAIFFSVVSTSDTLVDDSGLLFDANTAITAIGVLSAGSNVGVASASYDVVT